MQMNNVDSYTHHIVTQNGKNLEENIAIIFVTLD